MAEDKFTESSAQEYLKKHKILEMFENITESLVFERPENPKELMIARIKRLIDSRELELNYPCLFDISNIKCLFGMLNASSCGYITYAQYKAAFKAVGAAIRIADDDFPEATKITFDIFVTQMKDSLSKASATFEAPDFN